MGTFVVKSCLGTITNQLTSYGFQKFLIEHRKQLSELIVGLEEIGSQLELHQSNYMSEPTKQQQALRLIEILAGHVPPLLGNWKGCIAGQFVTSLYDTDNYPALLYLHNALRCELFDSDATLLAKAANPTAEPPEDAPPYRKRFECGTSGLTLGVVAPMQVSECRTDKSTSQPQRYFPQPKNPGTDTPASTGVLKSDDKIDIMKTFRYRTTRNLEGPFSVKDLFQQAQNDFNNTLQGNFLKPLLNELQRGQGEEKILTRYNVQDIESGSNVFQRNDKLIECLKNNTRENMWGTFLDALKEIEAYDALNTLFNHFSKLCEKNCK